MAGESHTAETAADEPSRSVWGEVRYPHRMLAGVVRVFLHITPNLLCGVAMCVQTKYQLMLQYDCYNIIRASLNQANI